jgi:hypothetical protein
MLGTLRVVLSHLVSILRLMLDNLKKQLDTNKIEDKTKELFKNLGF